MAAYEVGGAIPFAEPEIGSRAWWVSTEHWGARGIADCILSLLEAEAISRAKARELLEYMTIANTAAASHVYGDVPEAPWDKLNFYPASGGTGDE
jgi:hypothetical protein